MKRAIAFVACMGFAMPCYAANDQSIGHIGVNVVKTIPADKIHSGDPKYAGATGVTIKDCGPVVNEFCIPVRAPDQDELKRMNDDLALQAGDLSVIMPSAGGK